ncbi:MAG: hypothetical protein U0930_15175 [Pirellulales bacterium]
MSSVVLVPSNQPNSIAEVTRSEFIPAVVRRAGEQASKRFLEYFAARIRNKGTRAVYLQAAKQFFDWCETNEFALADIEPIVIAGYISSFPRSSAIRR